MNDGKIEGKPKDSQDAKFALWRCISNITIWINKSEVFVSSFAVFLIMIIISLDVLGRAFFNKPFMGTYELGQSLMVITVFLGLGFTQMSNGNISVDNFTRHLNPQAKSLLSIFTSVVGLTIFGLMAYSSGGIAWRSFEDKVIAQGWIGLPIWPSRAVVTIGAATIAMQFLVSLVSDIKALVVKHKELKLQ